jgi:hypothetical protein
LESPNYFFANTNSYMGLYLHIEDKRNS